MDPFEEFEFKPLTEGLGFHKKAADNKAEASLEANFAPPPATSSPTSAATPPTKTQKLIVDRGLDLLEEEPSLRPPLPRKTFHVNPMPTVENPTAAAVDEIMKTLKQNRRLEIEDSKKQIADLKNPKAIPQQYKDSVPVFAATLLDGMLVLASFLLCMIAMLVVTKVDLINNLSNPDKEGMIYLSTLTVFLGVNFVYLTLNRLFLGCTLGEWAYDQTIGTADEQSKAAHSFRVVLRVLLVMVTGFITLPIISQFANTDIAGMITGARLVKKV